MKYYKICATTPYCGTDAEEYLAVNETKVVNPDETAQEYANELNEQNATSFEYLIAGWNEEPSEDEIEWYHESCEGWYEEITKEEYEENT